ncbi:DUF4358 domain-containing protein [Caproiciproducens faecalis]|uniref:DUF4358 domain-containing protein n=1 Tax=Caproiciproducens faecalis TaxID=2820301 RepID=A0ABS7DNS0_9FIRM|nr:DUF4358 domain-containing protein [Caproiciproducens faecalis]MBW7572759.1 DUF4358 domain-containing protein [Caproiciproducens faecalis]
MKRAILVILAGALLFAAGCASGSSKTVNTEEAAKKLISSICFADQMSKIDSKTALQLYGLEESTVAKADVYESTGATAEEVAVFEAKDEASAAKVKEGAQKRIEDQRAGYTDYQPQEMKKLKSPVLVQSGKYVILCVSDDDAGAQKIIDELLK